MDDFYVIKNQMTGALHVPREQSSCTPRLYSTKGRASAAISSWMRRDTASGKANWEVVPVSLIEKTEGEAA